MPVLKSDIPENLRPYLFHGINLQWKVNGTEALGDCPWCGHEGKFSVQIATTQWRCLSCNEGKIKENAKSSLRGGNSADFLKFLWEKSVTYTSSWEELRSSRKLLSEETLKAWKVSRSVINNDWLVPGFGIDGVLRQLYLYRKMTDGKNKLLATPTFNHQIHGMNLWDNKKSIVYICEGPWDAMALWEVLAVSKPVDGGGLTQTNSRFNNLGAVCNVIAVPGCNVFMDSWLPLFKNKTVIIMFDNDHERTNSKTGQIIEPAAFGGVKRISEILTGTAKEIKYLKWGEAGFDKELPSGHDVRDVLTNAGEALGLRINALDWLLGKLHTFTSQALGSVATTPQKLRGKGSAKQKPLELKPCTDYKTLTNAWKKALKWTDGLDYALSVMLASVTSTNCVGDQLWVKILGPASCGKSTLCEALSVNNKYVLAKSTLRGFHSGFGDGSDGDDHSLINQLKNMTFITKDGDTLLQAPNLGQILSEARDIFDKVSRTSYRNKASRDYEGIQMTWLLCGTSALRQLDESELGTRFLDCVIMEGIDDELEDEILWRVVNRADRSISTEADGRKETQQEPEMTEAMQLTGGYITYLRENASKLLSAVDSSDRSLRKITRLGKFVAHIRARPSKRQDETAEREFASRLVSQHLRLAKCLAVVLNKDTLDPEVMARTTRVALDTARGRTLEICRALYDKREMGGLEVKTIAMMQTMSEEKTKPLLRFLKLIEVADNFVTKTNGVTSKPKWKLTDRMLTLWDEVHDMSSGQGI